MGCKACHESRCLVLNGGTNVLAEGMMCILWCPRDFHLTQQADMHNIMYIKLKLLATSLYTLCTYILLYPLINY